MSAEGTAGAGLQDESFVLLERRDDRRGGSGDGGERRRSRFGWEIQEARLSDPVLVLLVKPQRSTGGSENQGGQGGQAPGSGEQMSLVELKENLRTLMRLVANLAAEHDLMRPTVAVIDASSLSAPELDKFRSWPADQEWHQGAFLLFVREDSVQSEEVACDLLSARPPAFTEYSPPEQPSNRGIIEQLNGGDLPEDLTKACRDAVGVAESAGDSGQRRAAIEEVLRSWVSRRVDSSVSGLRGD